jgi:hypothetical protein
MILEQPMRLFAGLPAGTRHDRVGQDTLARNFAIDVQDKDSLHQRLETAFKSRRDVLER